MGFIVLAGEGLKLGKAGKSEHSISFGMINLKREKGWFKTKSYPIAKIVEIQEIDQEQFRSGVGTGAWGLVGLVVAGPLGAGFGAWFGGKTDNVVAAIKFEDDFKFMAQFSRRQYRKICSGASVTANSRDKAFKEFGADSS